MGGGTGLGAVHHQRQPHIGRQGQHLIGQLEEVPDDRVMQPLAAGLAQAHVVGRPAAAELLAAGRQLPDQVLQRPVMGLRPAAVRRLATKSLATPSRSRKTRASPASRSKVTSTTLNVTSSSAGASRLTAPSNYRSLRLLPLIGSFESHCLR
jgi:hypothetical protein